MLEAIQFWNEPNNLSHWDYTLDPDWSIFAEMVTYASQEVRREAPHVIQLLGGLSPLDPDFVDLMRRHGVLDLIDVVALHGFPLDWNLWQIDEWPSKIGEMRAAAGGKPVWVTEVGASSFGAEEVQLFGLQRTMELLLPLVPRVHWYSLIDLPNHKGAITRHKESEGSAYYRHFYFGLLHSDGSPKKALRHFPPDLGICQWIEFGDEEMLDLVCSWLPRLGVKTLRTGISWADWHRPDAVEWFDRMMAPLSHFDLTVTLCFTPPSRGISANHTSPPQDVGEFAYFAWQVARRYAG
ncbi:MAG: glycoside hydrolase 5 family protein [Chloroflexota bacterium]